MPNPLVLYLSSITLKQWFLDQNSANALTPTTRPSTTATTIMKPKPVTDSPNKAPVSQENKPSKEMKEGSFEKHPKLEKSGEAEKEKFNNGGKFDILFLCLFYMSSDSRF